MKGLKLAHKILEEHDNVIDAEQFISEFDRRWENYSD